MGEGEWKKAESSERRGGAILYPPTVVAFVARPNLALVVFSTWCVSVVSALTDLITVVLTLTLVSIE